MLPAPPDDSLVKTAVKYLTKLKPIGQSAGVAGNVMYNANDSYDDFKQGDYIGGVISAGAAITGAIPHKYSQAASAVFNAANLARDSYNGKFDNMYNDAKNYATSKIDDAKDYVTSKLKSFKNFQPEINNGK